MGIGNPFDKDTKISIDEYLPKVIRGDWKEMLSQPFGWQAPQYFPNATVAGINPTLDLALNQMAQYGNQFGGQQMGNAATAGNVGTNALASSNQFTNWQRRAGPNQFGYDQGTFDQTMGNLMPGLQGAFDAQTRDLNRGLNWSQLPGIDMSRIGAGQQGSTKAAQGGALATGMAQDRAADIGSQLWMNAANQANQAAYGAGMANLGSANDWRGDIMRGYQGTAGTGLPMLNQAFNMGQTGLQNRLQSGVFRQNQQQRNIDAEMARWNYNQQLPMNFYNQQMGAVQNSIFGAPQGTNQNSLAGGMNFLQGLAGLASGFGGMPQLPQLGQVAPPQQYNQQWSPGYAPPQSFAF